MKSVPEMPEAWEIYAGDDEALQVTVRDSECDRIDMSEFDVKAAWRCSSCSEDEVELRVDTSDAAHGVLTVFIDGDKTRIPDGPIRSGAFDIQTVKDGVTRTILRGAVAWRGDIER